MAKAVNDSAFLNQMKSRIHDTIEQAMEEEGIVSTTMRMSPYQSSKDLVEFTEPLNYTGEGIFISRSRWSKMGSPEEITLLMVPKTDG